MSNPAAPSPRRSKALSGCRAGWRLPMLLPLLLPLVPGMACRQPAPVRDDIAACAQALARIAEDPEAGAAACRAVDRAVLRADCLTAAAEALAAESADRAAAICQQLSPGPARDECHFQVAERAADVSRCDAAGAFADDCRLHRLSADLGSILRSAAADAGTGAPSPPLDFAAAEAVLAPRIADYGFEPDDMRPWSAAFRALLARDLPLDRSRCDAVVDPDRAEACRHTALALFQDMLNHARDTTGVPCDGGPLPPRLRYRPDPALDDILARRLATDLCP